MSRDAARVLLERVVDRARPLAERIDDAERLRCVRDAELAREIGDAIMATLDEPNVTGDPPPGVDPYPDIDHVRAPSSRRWSPSTMRARSRPSAGSSSPRRRPVR
jgi:hypothetical protein